MPRQFFRPRVTEEQALANRQITKQRLGKAVKLVGKVVSAPIRWVSKQKNKALNDWYK